MERKHEFDNYAEDYDRLLARSVSSYGGDLSYYAEHKSIVARQHAGIEPLSILDFGCGIGRNIPFLQEYFPRAEVFGYDVSADSVAIAKDRCPTARFFSGGDISRLHIPVDMVLIACVLHHVEPESRLAVMRQAQSLLSAKGEIFVFEHNPLNPLTRRAVENCPLDKDARLLRLGELKRTIEAVGLHVVRSGYTLYFPAALKKLQPIEKFLSALPLGTQYFVKATRS